MMAQRSLFASDALSMCIIAFGLLFASTVNAANSVINYTTSNGTVVAPQGNFTDASGNRLSVTSSSTTKLQFDGEIKRIDSYAFHNCSALTFLSLPNSVTSIGYFAFSNCTKLSKPIYNTTIFARLPINYNASYTIADGIKEIASAAFRNCTNLPSVTIANSVTKIDDSAFAYCTSLSSITFPNSTTLIGEHAFEGCSNLNSIYVGSEPAQITATSFKNVNKTTCVLYVPNGYLSRYKSATYWNEFKNIKEYSTNQDNENSIEYTENVVLSDGDPYTGKKQINAALFSYSRIFKVTTWGTIVLPVALDYVDWSSNFEIAEISGVNASFSSNGEIDSFSVQKTVLGSGSTTVPNRPYLIRAKVANSKNAQTISKKNCVVYPAEDKIVEFSSGNYSFQFKGTYSKIVPPNLDGKYYVNGGNWIAAKSTSSMNPMRVFLEINKKVEAPQSEPQEEYTITMDFPDGTAYSGTTIEYAALFSYSRIFSETIWGTIVLPVALDYEDWCSNFDIAEISGVNASFSSNGEIDSFSVQKTVLGSGSTTVPNRPYLIRAKVANSKTAQTISKKNCVVYPAEDKIIEFSYGKYSFQFKGSYSKIVAPNLAGKYIVVSGGNWIAAKSTSSMNPMRVFLEIIEKEDASQSQPSENGSNTGGDNDTEYTSIMSFPDGTAYSGTTIEYAALFSYSRMFKVTTWGTIVLPVALDYEDWCNKFEIAEISGVMASFSSNGEIDSFSVQKTVLGSGSTTVPNRPYLIRAKVANSKTAQTISKKNCVVYPAEDIIVEFLCGNYSFQFKGTYSKISAPNLEGKYYVNGGNWIAAKSTSSMNPMRVFLEIINSSSSPAKERNEETDIELLEDDQILEPIIISSRFLGLPPGCYTINGKRTIVTK